MKKVWLLVLVLPIMYVIYKILGQKEAMGILPVLVLEERPIWEGNGRVDDEPKVIDVLVSTIEDVSGYSIDLFKIAEEEALLKLKQGLLIETYTPQQLATGIKRFVIDPITGREFEVIQRDNDYGVLP